MKCGIVKGSAMRQYPMGDGGGPEGVWHHSGGRHIRVYGIMWVRAMKLYGIMKGRAMKVYGTMGLGDP